MIEDVKLRQPRLLACSSRLSLPSNSTVRFLITSRDVIHSFSVPSLGLKVDAVPGRVNQLYSRPSRIGLYFGQCSEICGSNHSFMPIEVKICSNFDYSLITENYLLEYISDTRGYGLFLQNRLSLSISFSEYNLVKVEG